MVKRLSKSFSEHNTLQLLEMLSARMFRLLDRNDGSPDNGELKA